MTTSLCSYSADKDFLHYFRRSDDKNVVKGVIATTDGVINCYKTESAFLSFIENIFNAYSEEKKDVAHNELENVLNILSEKGSGDDLTVAIIRGTQNNTVEAKDD